MKKIGLMADSSSGLLYAPFKHQIKIAKTTILFGDEELLDGVDILADAIYERLEQDEQIPKTAAPTTKEMLSQIQSLKDEGCKHILHFPISTNLSEYGKNIKQIIDPLIEDITFDVIDTKSATLLQGYLAYAAEQMVNKGFTTDQIKVEITKL